MDKGSETSQPKCVSEIHHPFGWAGDVLLIINTVIDSFNRGFNRKPSFNRGIWLSP